MFLGYRNLIVWQKAHELALEVYKITKNFPHDELFALTSQLRRAALSVPTNVVEGYARKSQKYFKVFLDTAFGSAIEVEYLLTFSREVGYLSDNDFVRLGLLCDEVGKLTWRLREHVSRRAGKAVESEQ